MGLKDVRKGVKEILGQDPNDVASCALCGAHRTTVSRILEGKDGYLCEDCAFTAVGCLVATKEVSPDWIGRRMFHLTRLVLDSLDARTPHAAIEGLFDGAIALAEGDPVRCRTVAGHAFRLERYAHAARALTSIGTSARTSEDSLGALAAYVTLGDRPATARLLAELEQPSLSELHRIQRDVHRAWATFRLDGRDATSFAFDPSALGPMIDRLRSLDAPASLGQALEVAAAYERDRDTDAALRFVDEALGIESKTSRHLLRGDILRSRDPAAARRAWQAGLAATHPDSIWARRARARLDDLHGASVPST